MSKSPQQLYAKIKRSSKYAYQHTEKDPFPVEIGGGYDAYIVAGNQNRYRIADLRFWWRVEDRFVALS